MRNRRTCRNETTATSFYGSSSSTRIILCRFLSAIARRIWPTVDVFLEVTKPSICEERAAMIYITFKSRLSSAALPGEATYEAA